MKIKILDNNYGEKISFEKYGNTLFMLESVERIRAIK